MTRRWNGWGDESVCFPLSALAKEHLISRLGVARPLPDISLADLVRKLPPSRLTQHISIDLSPETRLRHARGQSIPDLLALREGNLPYLPDGVAFPKNSLEVRSVLDWALQRNCLIVPYGGGTSVVGHLTLASQPDKPVLVISMEKCCNPVSIDPTSRIARFEAGITGPKIEAFLKPQGFLLGHYPQSFEYSSLGGWIMTRSSGQQSLLYGRIEHLFAGGKVETPIGTLEIPCFPASSAGPDLREWVMGSEGRLGILTEASVRISPVPEKEFFESWIFPEWHSGVEAMRKLAQSRYPFSMLRLSNPEETRTNFTLAGSKAIAWLERYLWLRKMRENRCLLLIGYTGPQSHIKASQVHRQLRKSGAIYLGRSIGAHWQAKRFMAPYLRESLWQAGYVVDTLETATQWTQVENMVAKIESALTATMKDAPVVAFTHLSHVYEQGASIYTTYLFPVANTYADTFLRWKTLKTAASSAISAQGGTISHQHGVGRDHQPWIRAEKGDIGIHMIQSVFDCVDPKQQMNPNNLIAANKP